MLKDPRFQMNKLQQAIVHGASPLAEKRPPGAVGPMPAVDPSMAMDELTRRTLPEGHLISPKTADILSRGIPRDAAQTMAKALGPGVPAIPGGFPFFGFPAGEIARAMAGNEGLSLAAQVPAMNVMNAVGGVAYKGARALTGELPVIGPAIKAQRGVGELKTAAVRDMLAQQGEQHVQIRKLHDATQAAANQTGETWAVVDKRIRDARMLVPRTAGASLAALSPEEQAIAKGYDAISAGQVAKDVGETLQPGVRHAHILRAQQRILGKVGEAETAQKLAQGVKGAVAEASAPEGDWAAGALQGPAERVAPVGPTPPAPKPLPTFPLVHAPTGEGSAMPNMGTARIKATEALAQEGMAPTASVRYIKKAREAALGAKRLQAEGMGGPVPFGQSAFRSLETYTPKPRPEFGAPAPEIPPYKPEAPLKAMFKAGPDQTLEMGPNAVAGQQAVKGWENFAAKKEAVAMKSLKRLDLKLKKYGVRLDAKDLDAAKAQLMALPSKLTGDAAAIVDEKALQAIKQVRGEPWWQRTMRAVSNVHSVQNTKRLSNPFVTAAESEAKANARLLASGEKAVTKYKSGFESELARTDWRAARRASAGFTRNFLRKYGEAVPDGAQVPKGKVLFKHSQISKAGFSKAEQAAMARMAVPVEEFRQFEKMTNAMRASSLGEAKGWLTSIGRGWKQVVLLTGRYSIRNATDNAITTWQAGGKAEYAMDAAKAVALAHGVKGIDPNQMIRGLDMTLGDYVATARRNGALTGGFVSSETIGSGGESVAAKLLTGYRDANAHGENFFRALLDMSARSRGMTAEEAGQLVDDMLGKYHPAFQSPFMKTMGQVGFPFVNWQKQIVKRGTRLAIERPGSVAQISSFQREANRSQGFAPQQVADLTPAAKESGAFVKKLPDGLVQVNPTTVYGPSDWNRMFGARTLGTKALLSNPLTLTYPWFQSIFATGGWNPRTMKEWTGSDVRTMNGAKALLKLPKVANALGVRIGKDGNVVAPDRVDWWFRQAGPQAAMLQALSSTDPQDERAATAFWTGQSSFIVDPKESAKTTKGIDFGAKKSQVKTYRGSYFNLKRELQKMQLEKRAGNE
jgi:hypothetical protein